MRLSSWLAQDYLREIGATPVLYGEGVAARVRAAAGGPVDADFDVAGKTPVEDLISLAPEPSRVVTIANFAAAQAGAQVTGGDAESHPMQALARVAELLAHNRVPLERPCFAAHHQHCRRTSGTFLSRTASSRAGGLERARAGRPTV